MRADRGGPGKRVDVRLRGVAMLLLVLAGAGCSELGSVRDSLRGATPREQYAASLERAGLDTSPLGRAWKAAGESALERAGAVTLPHAETGYFDPAQPSAVAFAFTAQEGQRLRVRVAPPDSTALFVDLFEVTGDSARAYDPVESGRDSVEVVRDAGRNTTYVLRLQPELLRGGRYQVTIEAGASVAFPVSGHGSGDIRSFFGAPRDGGRREHHGVDVFAPRGTPVVAVAPGVVTRVNETNLGGKVVWLRSGSRSYYYAHLDSQRVRPGTRVATGDTLGHVGNTGNARTTPPHLHFGIYAGGPRDPFPFIHEPESGPPAVTASLDRLGRRVRVASTEVRLRAGPSAESASRAVLPRSTIGAVVGASGGWYGVVLPDGARGYVPASAAVDASAPLRTLTAAAGRVIRAAPAAIASPIDSLVAGAEADVLGAWDAFLLVTAPSGRTGWLAPADR